MLKQKVCWLRINPRNESEQNRVSTEQTDCIKEKALREKYGNGVVAGGVRG